jgi:hypothetical protein
MLCPCCGGSVLRSASGCACGARFVGEPLDDTPIKVQRLGPAITSVGLLALVVFASAVATKWMAVAAVVVLWSAWRAMMLARRDAEWYGGYRTAATTFSVTLVASLALAAYGVAHIPKALENYRIKQIAATQASMHHIASLLEDYKLRVGVGAYPSDEVFKELVAGSTTTDYWDSSIKYQPRYDRLAETSITLISNTSFELRSAGPDGIVGNDDDIIMRDGIFFTNAEIRKQTARPPR